ncbi:DUF1127 domain-containing protein [Phaeobacter gallaeciensis]|uniref:DUF1127 domain-containing protein n=2 Tax=Roseobacteraceae TaxID=2854170 RepID=A0A366WZB9_9RHOB|nr:MULTISPECIES: DUF1127 domain-containing protein [Roseobacteraceae]MBT3140000.1 DUF1127 domain-containing protein [Falsiruegeria litorea]RBW55920.1 DUF1127 domain-containing protein [Phaeobacter gallaeciensis]
MAITRSNSGLDVVLDAGRTFFHQKRTEIQHALARRKAYRATHHELSTLTDRDLQDLGIPRSNIKRLAMEAAYDC